MPLYFFHVFDGNAIREVTEADCASPGDVRIRMLEAALRFAQKAGDRQSIWSLEVRDDRGSIISMLDLVDYPSQGAPTIRLT